MTESDNEEDFAALLADYEKKERLPQRRNLPKVGDKVSGTVVSVGNEAIFVALGGIKAEAILDKAQVLGPKGEVTIQVGDSLEARVADIRQDGQFVLRVAMGRGPDARAEIAQAHAHGIPVEGVITAVIKGGVDVQVAGMRAFCPVSQLDNRFVQDPALFVGQRHLFRITRYEESRGRANIVLSRRALLEEEAAQRANETREKLKVGAVLQGKVTTIKRYGAFVDLGGIEGLLPVSELGFTRVEDPADVLSVGQTVEVQVAKIEKTGDPKKPEKVGLSLKALAEDPWQKASEQFVEGGRVRGKISRLAQFGAFVELAPGVEGLIHISELGAGRRLNHAREAVNEGQEVEVVVLGIDKERRRISLSVSAVQAQEEAAEVASFQPTNHNGFGTFGDLLKKTPK